MKQSKYVVTVLIFIFLSVSYMSFGEEKCLTGDSFISSPSKKIELQRNLQADAVEMEGAAVAQICWQKGVACLVVRCIGDAADENAECDYETFYHIAARNSALLVGSLIEQLALRA